MAKNKHTESKSFDIKLKKYEPESGLRESEFYFVNGRQKILSEVEIGNHLWCVFMEYREVNKPDKLPHCEDRFYEVFFLFDAIPPLAFREFAALEVSFVCGSCIYVSPTSFVLKRQCHNKDGPHKVQTMMNVFDQFNKSEFGKLTLTIKIGESDDSDHIKFFSEKQLNLASVNNFVEYSNKLFQNDKLSDVTLKIRGREFPAHKFVLFSASSMFEAMFDSNFCESRNNVIEIRDFDFQVILEMLKFIYTHKSPQFRSLESKIDVVSLYKASHRYDIKHLLDLCRKELFRVLNIDNALDILLLADIYQEPFLKKAALNFVFKHPPLLSDILKYERVSQQPELMEILTSKFQEMTSE